MRNIRDEYTREYLATRGRKAVMSNDAIDTLSDLFITRGITLFIYSDNGPKSVSGLLRIWLLISGATESFIGPGNPWENGYIRSFDRKFKDEPFNRGTSDTLPDAKAVSEKRRKRHNASGLRGSLG